MAQGRLSQVAKSLHKAILCQHTLHIPHYVYRARLYPAPYAPLVR